MQWWQADFIYTRKAMELGQWWRIVTSQFVHTNWAHYLLNMSSLGLLGLLFYTTLHVRTFTISLFLLVLSVGTCLHIFVTSLHWYAGLSGALYGLYVVAAYSALKKKDYFMGISVGLLVSGKVAADHFFGAIHDNSSLIDAHVVIEAHNYGVLSAFVLIALDAIYNYIKRKPNKTI
ncbi:rhombosortase [Leucothrix arctica]|nr:rhombosortase [Leucothrix arctica]